MKQVFLARRAHYFSLRYCPSGYLRPVWGSVLPSQLRRKWRADIASGFCGGDPEDKHLRLRRSRMYGLGRCWPTVANAPIQMLSRIRNGYWDAIMHIGLIGGIGVAATLVYYQRLSAAVNAKGARLRLTISHGDIQSLITNNLADARQPQAEIFARQIEELKAAGAEVAALSSLGAHFCYAELEALSPLPLVSAVTPLDRYFVTRGVKRVGLLGTRGVMQTRLYGQLKQTQAVAMDDDIETLGQTYQDVAVAGVCAPDQRQMFLDAGRRMVDEQGADAIVLAGTDLNLAFDGQAPGYEVIDALDVHVELLARLAAGEVGLADIEVH